MNVYAVLMAGGVGTRFWPRSRMRNPKQVLNIIDSDTMIQATYKRLKGLVEPDKILVVTNIDQKEIIHEQLPELPEDSFILEPEGKNTAPCIGLAAIHILRKDPDAVMVVLPADHLVKNVDEFQHVIKLAVKFLREKDGLITLGITPTEPSTGYGYIQRGEKIADLNNHEIFRVKTFAEKPNYDTAVRFLESGDCYWNSGMFIWRAERILQEISDKLPEIYEGLMQVKQHIGKADYQDKLKDVYRRIRGISIDFGVMQTAEEVFVIPTDMGWNDVGSWETVYEISPKDKNKIAGEFVHVANIDSGECYIYAPEKVVALVGVKNLIVVDTGDAILICKKNRAQDVKEVVEQLKRDGLEEYL